MMKNHVLFLVLMNVIGLIGVYLSSSGLLKLDEVLFTPTSGTSSAFMHQNSNTKSTLDDEKRSPIYDRLVIVLVDALRADMALGSEFMYGKKSSTSKEELNTFMPYTNGLIESGQAIGYVAHASVPTVTMPRLKAIVTGKAPAFIDILKNFNSAELNEENLIQLLEKEGYRIVFYGDDTWLKLFPHSFQRQDGTSGFFARDTVEVDTNVTRHLKEELDPMMKSSKSHDWDVLILHYLGLDHVGHLRGPRSKLMQSKLIEMDDIIKYVHESIQKQDLKRIQENPQALPSLLLLCSDHGMSESGNHGGPTLEESSALMMFFGLQNKKQFKKTNQQKNRRQVDLVPTLSGLFDLKIPTYNTGLVLPQEIFSSQIKYLKALLKNFQQLYQLCKIRPAHHRFAESFYHKHRSLFDYMDHQKEHKETDNTLIQKIHDASLELQERVSLSDDSDFDILKISSGIGVIIMVILLFFLFGRTSFMFFYDPEEVNGGFCFDLEGFLLVLWSLLQIISLTSSSRIENEHVTYFFSLTTLLLSYGIKQFFLCRNTTNEPKSEIVTFIGLTILLRLLRSRNQIINFGRLNGIVLPEGKPGQEFAKDESVSILSTASLEFFPSNLNFVQFSIIQSLYVSFLLIWMILSLKIFFYTKKKSFILMFVWTLMTVGLSCSLQCSLLAEEEISFSSTSTATATSTASASATEINRYAQAGYLMSVGLVALAFVCEKSHHRLLIIECSFWIIVTILQRNGNLPSLAVLAFFLGTLNTSHIFKTWAAWKIALFNIWLSQCAFFALGNSHLVTTIDISQVYHGLNEFSQGIVGFFTFVNVFSGPILCTLNVLQLTKHKDQWMSTLLIFQFLRYASYTLVVYFVRFHLFIWSVFAPKMLYEIAFMLFYGLFVMSIYLLTK